MKTLIDQRTALALACTMLAAPAFAAGSVDTSSSLQSILTWGLTAAGIVIAIISLVKVIQAVADGRPIGPTLIVLVVGTAICFGGAAIVQHFGVGA